jgi:hypothetical protein
VVRERCLGNSRFGTHRSKTTIGVPLRVERARWFRIGQIEGIKNVLLKCGYARAFPGTPFANIVAALEYIQG